MLIILNLHFLCGLLSLFENITLQSVVYKNFTISLTLLFPGVAKTEFLLIISIQYQRDK